MKILTQIIETTKEEMKTFFKDRCQSKIEKFEKAKLKHKLHYCSHCNKEHLYILRGKRDRRLRTSHGEITFKIQQIACKHCKKVCRPLIDWLGLKSKQIITEEFLEKGIQAAINTSYQVASKLTKSLTGENLSSRTIRTGMIKKSLEIKQDQANAPPKEYIVILEDATKCNTGKTKRGEDIHVVYGITGRKIIVNKKTGEVKRQLLIGDILSVTVGNNDNINFQHITENVMTDGAGSNKKKKYQKNNKNVTYHRCHWHFSRMLGFSLYNDGLKTKKERIPYVSKFALIIKHSYTNFKQYYDEIIAELKEKKCFKSVKYLENAKQEFYNTKEKPVIIDGIPLLANSPIERVRREIDRRVDNGARWCKEGLEAITTVRLHYIYNS